ncbi:MAG: hypothetical protein RhofKO_08450 [Rhodothermales bacterium]
MLVVLAGMSGLVQAQAPVLGDDFVFFINGSNILIPEVDGGIVVDDPLSPGSGNKVMMFNNANFAEQGWAWPEDVGADVSQNVGATAGEGDTLFVRILSDPANAGHEQGLGPNSAMRIQFLDREVNSGDLQNGNHPFRIGWVIPESVHDGQWHELAIPLPPSTTAALDSAKVGKKPDGSPLDAPFDALAQHWYYSGAWSDAGRGIAPPGLDLYGETYDPALFKEFEWGNVKKFGVAFDWNDAGSTGAPIYFDYFYVGGSGVDLDALAGPPEPMSGVSAAVEDGDFMVSWTHDPQYAGYNVYASDQPITDVTDPLVVKIGDKNFEDTDFSVTYNYLAPHTTLASEFTMYFAVTPVNRFGEENTDITTSTAQATGTLLSKPHVFEITEVEADAILDLIDAGTVEGGPLVGTYVPFQINSGRYREGGIVGPDVIREDRDLSAKLWAAFLPEQEEVYLYMEITDDTLNAALEGQDVAGAWQYDSVEINWGLYEPISRLLNSDHRPAGTGSAGNRGEEPDYQLRVAPYAVAGSQGDELAGYGRLYETFSGVGEISAGAVINEEVTDGSGNTVGWKALAFVPWSVVRSAGGDQLFAGQGGGLPSGDELKLGLMNFSVNDNDSPGTYRDTYGMWTQIPEANGGAWNDPKQWEIVAFAGRDVPYDPTLVEIPGAPFDFNRMALVVDDANANSINLEFGFVEDATGAFDAGMDIFAPPPPPSGAFDARFLTTTDDLLHDLRSYELEATWRLALQPSTDGLPITLTWSAIELPREGTLRLQDTIDGSFVDVDMTAQTSYPLTQNLAELQITYSILQRVSRPVNVGWNLVGLPLDVANANYRTLFPDALFGTFFGFDDRYVVPSPAELTPGEGYWLRMGDDAQQATIAGLPYDALSVDLEEGWNLVAGPNCSMPVDAIQDAGGIILPGTLFGFNATYEVVDTIEPLEGYWVRATAAGSIAMDCNDVAATKQARNPLLADFGELVLEDARGQQQRLYFNAQGQTWAEGAFSVPPGGPGRAFTAAFENGRYVATQTAGIVLAEASYPLRATVTRAPERGLFTLSAGNKHHNLAQGTQITVAADAALALHTEALASDLPTTYVMEQNYPNPFNPTTTLRFGIPEQSTVSITVFDLLGRQVATVLQAKELEAGWHTVEFDGQDLASGTYIYRMEASDFSRARRFMLLK